MHYVYVLISETDGDFYTGCTNDLKRRFAQHISGEVPSTCERRPLRLIYYEASLDKNDAFRREKYLKTTYGKRFIRSRCRGCLSDGVAGGVIPTPQPKAAGSRSCDA